MSTILHVISLCRNHNIINCRTTEMIAAISMIRVAQCLSGSDNRASKLIMEKLTAIEKCLCLLR